MPKEHFGVLERLPAKSKEFAEKPLADFGAVMPDADLNHLAAGEYEARYLGPALAAVNGEKILAETLAAIKSKKFGGNAGAVLPFAHLENRLVKIMLNLREPDRRNSI